jgi:colicin import membrane protein
MAELRQATKQWAQRKKSNDLVWRGATAHEALATVKKHVIDLSALEREFLDEARRGLARSRRRKVAVLSTILVTLVAVIGAGAWFTIQLSRANAAAQEKAEEAEKATKQVQAQLDEVRAAQAAQEKAQKEAAEKSAEAVKANAVASQSQEDLAKANLELQKKVEETTKANEVAQELARVAQENARTAAVAKAAAEKATAEAKAANARTQALLDKEKERVKQLEANQKKISTGGL